MAPASDETRVREAAAGDVAAAPPLRAAAPPPVPGAPPALVAHRPPTRSARASAALIRWRHRGAAALRRTGPAAVRGARALGPLLLRGGRTVRAWARRPTGRLAVAAGLLASGLLLSGVGGAVVWPTLAAAPVAATPSPTHAPPSPPASSGLPSVPPVPVPEVTTPDVVGPRNPAEVLTDWAEQTTARTEIPVLALEAYAYAELVLAEERPACGLRWTTLAAIGEVESGHGSAGDATLLADGRALPPIVGPPLDGEDGRAHVPDTDGGTLDDDPTLDRAVGPMQFLPSTWRQQAVDATGDGVADVHNLYDAALAAAHYLCADGRDLSDAEDWWSAVRSYNDVGSYAEEVFRAAEEYGVRSRG